MANDDDEIPQVVVEEWAMSIRWLHAHPEALNGKRGLSAFVQAVVEEAEGQRQERQEEAVMMISDPNEQKNNKV